MSVGSLNDSVWKTDGEVALNVPSNANTFDANEMYPELSESWLFFFRESLFVRTGLAALDPQNRCSGPTNWPYFDE